MVVQHRVWNNFPRGCSHDNGNLAKLFTLTTWLLLVFWATLWPSWPRGWNFLRLDHDGKYMKEVIFWQACFDSSQLPWLVLKSLIHDEPKTTWNIYILLFHIFDSFGDLSAWPIVLVCMLVKSLTSFFQILTQAETYAVKTNKDRLHV